MYIITRCHRLQGYREKLRIIDPTADMIISRQEAARYIKLAEAEHHRVIAVAHQSYPKKSHPFSNATITNDHRRVRLVILYTPDICIKIQLYRG